MFATSPARRSRSIRHRLRDGFTLVEMLVTVAVTLIIVYGLVEMFQWVGQSVADGRGVIELSGNLRGVTTRLQKDLDGLTVPVRPWPELGSAEGYFEIFEGAQYDGQTAPADTLTGDLDDALLFTAYSVGEPFTAQVLGQVVNIGGRPTLICNPAIAFYNAAGPAYTTLTSNAAEIIWWTRFQDLNGNNVRDQGEVQTLHRRVLLIRPDIDTPSLVDDSGGMNPPVVNVGFDRPPVEFFNSFDLSARRTFVNATSWFWTTNSLSDLTQRENRFAHNGAAFPHALMPAAMFTKTDLTWSSPPARLSAQLGEDVVHSHVLSFDVRVYDPAAQIVQYNSETVVPGDPGWTAAKNLNNGAPPGGVLLGTGAYVDLNYSRLLTPTAQLALNTNFPTDFSGVPYVKSQLAAMPTYDTWSWSYERDGVNQYNNVGIPPGTVDEGTDGLDNDGINGTDDVGERETSPPYPVPLRGIQVTIRAYEPDTRQVRQQAVIAKFIPE